MNRYIVLIALALVSWSSPTVADEEKPDWNSDIDNDLLDEDEDDRDVDVDDLFNAANSVGDMIGNDPDHDAFSRNLTGDDIDQQASDGASRYSEEVKNGNYEHVLEFIQCIKILDVSLDYYHLSKEEQAALTQKARKQAVSQAVVAWKRLQKTGATSYEAEALQNKLALYPVTPADLKTTPEKLEQRYHQVYVEEARSRLKKYEKDLDAFSLIRFLSNVDRYRLSPKELGLSSKRLKELQHTNDVNDARTQLDVFRGGPPHNGELTFWGYFDHVLESVKKGVTLEELEVTPEEWKTYTHGYNVYQAQELLDTCRERADSKGLAEVQTFFDKGVTLKDLWLSQESWEALPHELDVKKANEALKACKLNDSAKYLAEVENFLTKGVALKELNLTPKKLDALRQYIKTVNE